MDAVIALRAAELYAQTMGFHLAELFPRIRVLAPGETQVFTLPDVERCYLTRVEAGIVVESDTGTYNLRMAGEQAQVHEGQVRLTNASSQPAQVEFLVVGLTKLEYVLAEFE